MLRPSDRLPRQITRCNCFRGKWSCGKLCYKRQTVCRRYHGHVLYRRAPLNYPKMNIGKKRITTISTASPRRSTHIGPAYENSIGSRPSSTLVACQRQVQVYPKNRHCTYLWTARPLAGGEVVVAVGGPFPGDRGGKNTTRRYI